MINIVWLSEDEKTHTIGGSITQTDVKRPLTTATTTTTAEMPLLFLFITDKTSIYLVLYMVGNYRAAWDGVWEAYPTADYP